ncbi:MAG: glycogen synthase GlgA [Immundisolibacter sp.]|uniref:glycogen synthase GlgA n=1 Tax=Immundisolibacter sp. TaxID=1934948 RepID=UPI003EDFB30A
MAVSRHPRILLAASEAWPLIKTGGLGDVVGALPAALRNAGADARLVLPAYPAAMAALAGLEPIAESALYGSTVTLFEGHIGAEHPAGRVPVYLVGSPAFDRPGNPYQDNAGQDWPDNARRFALFCRAAAALALGRLAPNWRADIVHAHDWQTGLLPALLSLETRRPRSVFTIHNLAYQGLVPASDADALSLPPEWWRYQALEFHGQLALIKGGIVYADRVTTVSPRYAREITTPEFGCGLDGLLRHRAAALSGILNGIDSTVWNPSTDPALSAPYDRNHLAGKQANKAALQAEMGLAVDTDALLLGLVGRLVAQKGIDLLLDALPRLLAMPVQVVVLGSGEATYVQALHAAAAAAPSRVAFRTGYDEALAHRIQAGVDALLVPSRFEPCGLTQLYALRYGTVPIVRAVGGLADTVVNATPRALATGRATGIRFQTASAAALLEAVERACALFRADEPWRQLQHAGMAKDHSWAASARAYMALYRALLDGPG